MVNVSISEKFHDTLLHAYEQGRQIMFPEAFRISSPDELHLPVPPATEPDSELHKEILLVDSDSQELVRQLVGVITAIWRIHSKLVREDRMELPSELRHLRRHIQSAWDGFMNMGFEVQDHLGEKYDPGMAVSPVSYQPMEGVAEDTIVETLKPTIYYRKLKVQRADVIIAGPNNKTV